MANILVVEGETLVARLLEKTLHNEGYHVVTVLNGEDAVQYALRETPHLIILNMHISGVDGLETVRQLRSQPKTMHIPVLSLSDLSDPSYKIHAYDTGVDDFVTSPFNTDELLARVRVQLRRSQQCFLSPLVGLPGGYQVELAIKRKLHSLDPWSILYLDLDNFKAFNDVYGFLTGNDLIRLVGRICQRVVHEYGNDEDFVGHIGGDDFVVLTTPDLADSLSFRIRVAYKEESIAFYHPEDLRRGSISGFDRKGRPYQFPLVSLSIGVVNNQVRRPHTFQEVSYLAAEAKSHAKHSDENVYHISPRRDVASSDLPYSPSLRPPSSLLPPSLAQFAAGHTHHEPDIIHIVESQALLERSSEYEQKVH